MFLLQRRPTISVLLTSICILIIVVNALALGKPRRFTEAIRHDIARYKGMVHRVQWRSTLPPPKRRVAMEEPIMQETQDEEDPPIGAREAPLKSIIDGSVKLPLYAAADYGIGLYFVDVELGEPPKKLRMVADTGSDLTWVKCTKDPQGTLPDGRGYMAAQSTTFQTIGCDTPTCKDEFMSLASLDICPTPNAPCLYNYSYGIDDQTVTYGMFGKETVTVHTTKNTTVRMEKILVGCSQDYYGKANIKEADGILGLGINPYSFSLHAVNLFGGTFQYCLVDHLSHTNKSSYLIFGDQREKAPTYGFMRYTSLRTNILAPYLWVNLKGISIGRKMLDIPPLVWFHENGGTILDSGTALTYWAEPAYRVIMDELIAFLAKDHPKIPNYGGDGTHDFEYCFNATTSPLDPSMVPRLEIHFTDGARFRPHVKSYIIDDSPEVKCIGFLEARGGMHIIGNIMQQNYLWEFDLHHAMVGFSPSTCS